jgi:hypothetical protein
MDLSQVNIYVRGKGQDIFNHSVAKRNVKILQMPQLSTIFYLKKPAIAISREFGNSIILCQGWKRNLADLEDLGEK